MEFFRRCIQYKATVLLVLALESTGQTPPEITPRTLNITIDRVVAHTSSAVIFSHGELELTEGPQVILLRNLSSASANVSLEEKSLQVNLEGGGALVERIIWDDVPLATAAELEALEEDIQEVKANRTRYSEKIQILEKHMATLQTFGSSLVTPTSELVSKADSIVQVLKDAHAAQIEVDESIYFMKQKRAALDDIIGELQTNLRYLSRPQRVAKVFISVEAHAVITFHLQIIVASVRWRPHYEIHVNSTTGFVTMAYHALVHQQTEHAWTNVSMELCTGAPSSDRKLPSLTPWLITSSATRNERAVWQHSKRRAKSNRYAQNTRHPNRAATELASASGFDMDDDDADAGAPEELEREEGNRFARPSSAQSEVVSSGVSHVFVLPKRQSIPPAQDIRVHIATIQLKANLTYTAVPKKSTKIYVQASVTNDSPYTLLPGTSLVFVDGGFVGSSNVNLIPINGHAFLDVGIDNALSVLRKGVSVETRSTGVAWISPTKTTEFNYELVLKSARASGVIVHVKDQVPLPQSEDLKVVVSKPSIGELKANHKQIQIDESTTLQKGGELVWERYLKPDSTLSIFLLYTIEVDANRYVRNTEFHNLEL